MDETYADIAPVRLNKDSKTAFVSIQRGCDNMVRNNSTVQLTNRNSAPIALCHSQEAVSDLDPYHPLWKRYASSG